MKEKGMGFCNECRKETEYILCKRNIEKRVRGKEYTFSLTTAICTECGAEIGIPELIDLNINEFDEQYREAESIVSMEGIDKMMSLYETRKVVIPAGLDLKTLSRYQEGQIPSKEDSDAIKAVLKSSNWQN